MISYFSRLFTKANNDPNSNIAYKNTNHNPYFDITFTKIIHNNIEYEVPCSWSETAIKIVREKYLRKAGVPNKLEKIPEEGVPEWLQCSKPTADATFGQEVSFKQFFERLAGAWTYWGWNGGHFNSEEDARIFYDEIVYILSHQIALANSPQCFNTGLHWAYGIEGESNGRQFYVDPITDDVICSDCGYKRPQPHACFIMSIKDQLIGEGGIMDHWHKEALMFKYGSGVGSNFSTLRGTGEPLSSGGFSSGLPSWLLIGDRSAGAVKSGGTTRRAAKMVILDIDHPDVEWFITWKTIEEEKVMFLAAGSQNIRRHAQKIIEAFNSNKSEALERRIEIAKADGMAVNYIDRLVSALKQGHTTPELMLYDTHWLGEAVKTVSGQNSNNTVSVTDEFMSLIHTDKDFSLIRRVDGGIHKKIKAKYLWDQIVYNAWASADPGVHFRDTINAWHTCPQDGPINASNPCSEYLFLDDTACNLASLNLVKFLRNDSFDHQSFSHVCKLFTTVLEISVHMAQFPSRSIARRSYDFRTLGLGYANIGGLLMRLGFGYHSDEGRAIAGAITSLMTGIAYKTSAEIAAKLGPFKNFQKNRQDMLRVIRNHARACGARSDKYEQLNIMPAKLIPTQTQYEIYMAAQQTWKDVEQLGEEYGFRNAQVTVIAPTGTIGMAMDCDTLGCEPDFALVKYKELCEGGYIQIINQSVPYGLQRLGYNQTQITEIIQYISGHKDLNNEVAPINMRTLGAFNIVGDNTKLAKSYNITDLNQDIALRFNKNEIDASNLYYFGTKTIEGAPHIKNSDLSVFDCATRCGPLSTRSLHWKAHTQMLATIQPFISGAISKTINLENNATIEEFGNSLESAYNCGLKCVAQYRDGSKSQPLSSFNSTEEMIQSETIKSLAEDIIYDFTKSKTTISAQNIHDEITRTLHAPMRRILPMRRSGYTQKVYIGGHKILWRTGEYDDGSLGEIFIDTHREGATFRSLMNGFAILFSLALQYGMPLEVLYNSFKDTKFEPSGIVIGHAKIKFATSIFSIIVHDLWLNYGTSKDVSTITQQSISQQKHVFSGDICTNCGMSMVTKSGTCTTCMACGSNTGCG